MQTTPPGLGLQGDLCYESKLLRTATVETLWTGVVWRCVSRPDHNVSDHTYPSIDDQRAYKRRRYVRAAKRSAGALRQYRHIRQNASFEHGEWITYLSEHFRGISGRLCTIEFDERYTDRRFRARA